MSTVGAADAETASALYAKLTALRQGLIAQSGASNNWAVAGAKSASGGAMLAGDPHLHLTLPAIWFQMTQDSPSYHSSGVAIPGTPGVLIGHNQHIAWSLTDAENQQTFFYVEKEDAAHPGMYLWNGTWTPYTTVSYEIPVLGQKPHHLTVRLSVHGPVISERGQTTSVWWAGNIPSQDLSVLMAINRASDWTDFRGALQAWYSPTHNFVYADDNGNIGMISAGYYPQFPAKAQPWLPMPGTGEDDVTGTIPYDDIPQAYDPPDDIIWSANQRQVTANYPYYIGTASNFFDPGYRANEIHRVLSQPGKLTAADMQYLQTDTRDFLASEVVPMLLQALSNEQLNSGEKAAAALLKSWDYRMDASSKAATVWWFFWQEYLHETFSPWWTSRHVKVAMSEVLGPLGQDLEAWTLGDPTNRAFSAPGVGSRTATEAMQKAFRTTVAELARNHMNVEWGRVHTRVLDNLAQISGLSYGPRSDRGDANTPLAAGGFPSDHGPSWRMVVDWGTRTFEGVYPGGQSENPASAWYTNRVDTWWAGGLDPMLSGEEATASTRTTTWTLRP
jgi:penicillin amidase